MTMLSGRATAYLQTSTRDPLRASRGLRSTHCARALSTAYYSTWKMLGKEKRDLLRSNVESVQEEQREAADIETLLADMRASIEEADRFLATIQE